MIRSYPVERDARCSSEMVAEFSLAEPSLPHQRLSGNNVDVGLGPPAAYRLPTTLPDHARDSGECFGVRSADPGVIGGTRFRKLEGRKGIEHAKDRPKGRIALLQSLLERPSPCNVDVC